MTSPQRHDARFLSLLFAVLCLAVPVRAEVLPLPKEEQEQVNQAIDRGVAYLKRVQQKVGTWPRRDNNHLVGYTALPALTLLECGVPTDDPVIRRAAGQVRGRAAGLDTTYEISLSILFLDRLGDPADKKLIQTLALRLVAGQSPTGGWGYKVPTLTARQSQELLTALKRTEPESMPLDLVVSRPKDTTEKSKPVEVRPTDPKSRESTIDTAEVPRDESRYSPR